MSLIGRFSSALKHRTAYRAALLQAKAYRILRHRSTNILRPYQVSTIGWGLLGLLADQGPMRPLALAQELGVEAPFVTVMMARLAKKGLISISKDPRDSRAKSLSLTPKGKEFLLETEQAMRADVEKVLPGVSARDVLGYLAVLEKIVEIGIEKGSKKKRETEHPNK